MDSQIIEEIKGRLVDLYHPMMIFLFGSYAWGAPEENSDLDIAVVVKQSDEKPYRRVQKGTLALWDIKVPIDLLVFTLDEFKERLQYRSTLQYLISQKGIKIYEAA